MNKTELIDAIAAQADISKAAGGRALDAAVESITGALKNGDSVSLIGFGTFYQIDDDSAFFQICRAGAGQGQLARGAHHQLHAQVLFQCSNLPRDHRTCHSKLIGYGGKTAEIRYPHKQVHCIKTIHCCKYGNDDLLIVIYFGTDDASKVQSWPTCGLKPGNFPPALTKPHGR